MKKYTLLVLIMSFVIIGNSQETYFTSFKIKDKLKSSLRNPVYLYKTHKIAFKDLDAKEKKNHIKFLEDNIGGELNFDTVSNVLKLKKSIKIPKKKKLNKIYKGVLKNVKFDVEKKYKFDGIFRGHVKFKDNKVIVNNSKLSSDDLYYYKLVDGEVLYLNFRDISISGLTIPLKYRIRNKDKMLEEQFGSSFNANLFIGYTFLGIRSFYYRKGMENKSNTFKMTAGGFIGASTVKLNSTNTDLSLEPLSMDEITEGLASIGAGINLSFNKLNFGFFVGWDYSLGTNADKWNYNKEPWLGLAIGYSIINI